MQRFVIGNWKSYKSLADARLWLDEFAVLYRPVSGLSVIIAPSFICLDGLAAALRESALPNVFLAAQDISPFPKGAYTGAVAADMVKGMVDYVIIGHSERRRYFHETHQDIVNKVSEAVDAGLAPIVCIDKPEELLQLGALQDMDCEKMIIAYGPVDALNFRIPESPNQVGKAAGLIARMGPARPIVYGGAVAVENARQYAAIAGISGLFIGTASLEASSLAAICKVFS
jgi:triosephosphate isomerase (TIM)